MNARLPYVRARDTSIEENSENSRIKANSTPYNKVQPSARLLKRL
jgi:hypothetical protein